MQLTLFTDYGLRCLMFLAAHEERLCSVKEIADAYGISRNHLVKVAHRLGQIGFVASSKGKGGGLKLARPADTYRLGDLVKELEPDLALVECMGDHNTCRITSTCRLKNYLYQARQAFLNALNAYTLADTIRHDELIPLLLQRPRLPDPPPDEQTKTTPNPAVPD